MGIIEELRKADVNLRGVNKKIQKEMDRERHFQKITDDYEEYRIEKEEK